MSGDHIQLMSGDHIQLTSADHIQLTSADHSAGKRDRDPNPPPVACSKVAEGGREL